MADLRGVGDDDALESLHKHVAVLVLPHLGDR